MLAIMIPRYPSVGGQAVMEGVMMRTPRQYATAVRLADGSIKVEAKPYTSVVKRIKWLDKPILRGFITLFEMLAIGMKTLTFSADALMEEENARIAKEKGTEPTNKGMSQFAMWSTIAISLILGLLLFVYLPLWLTEWMGYNKEVIGFNLILGIIKVAFLILYMAAIAQMPDMKRVFQYHGAEHKVVFTYEAGQALTVDNARQFTTFHPRCGTSFLLIVVLVSIILFTLVDFLIALWLKTPSIPIGIRFPVHLLLMPIVAGLAAECIKLSGKIANTKVGKMFTAPGLWLQRITTAPPDDSMLEIAIAALKSALDETTLNSPNDDFTVSDSYCSGY